ncbi:MAG TPA: hypothetical protein VFD58_19595 [Blastocatellia bacterium]|nr:hypothetical protein [Blastocatellia bacterium]
MSTGKYSSKLTLLVALSLLFTAFFTLPGLQAQSKKEEKKPEKSAQKKEDKKPEKKDPRIRIEDAVVRNGNTAKVKPDFEFVKSGDNRVTVRSLRKDTSLSINGNFSCKCDTSGGSCSIASDGRNLSCKPARCDNCVLTVSTSD